MINALANALDTTSIYLLGYEPETVKRQITTFADVAATLFELEKVVGLKFDVDVKRPPRNDNWECSIKFDGKAHTELNADMCLFLEDWAAAREDCSSAQYEEWKDKALAYYVKAAAQSTTETNDNTITQKIMPPIELQGV